MRPSRRTERARGGRGAPLSLGSVRTVWPTSRGSTGPVTRGIMRRQSAASPGALPDEQRGERAEAAGAARVAWCRRADSGGGRSLGLLASTAPDAVDCAERERRTAPAAPDSGGGAAPGAGWRGSHTAAGACRRAARQATGSGGDLRQRAASWSGPDGLADGSGRQNAPPPSRTSRLRGGAMATRWGERPTESKPCAGPAQGGVASTTPSVAARCVRSRATLPGRPKAVGPSATAQAPVAPARANAAQHVPRKTVRTARTGKRTRGSAARQRSPVAERAPAAMTQCPWTCAPQVCSHVCRTMGPPRCPPRWRCPHWRRGWLAAWNSSVKRGRLWVRMRGVRAWGRGHTRGTEGPGSRAALRASTHCTCVTVWHLGQWRLRQA